MNNSSGHWDRREFLRGAALAGTAGLVGLRSDRALAEPPPETKRIRLLNRPTLCEAPQYVAEELLQGEGFRDIQYIKKGIEPAVVSHPRRATSGSGESHAGSRRRRGACSPAGQGPPAFLPVGGAHHRPPFPNQEGVEDRLPRHGGRRLGPHSSASPAGQRQKPGCAWLRGVPCSAAFCTRVCSRSARLLETWPTNPLPSTNKSIFLVLLEL